MGGTTASAPDIVALARRSFLRTGRIDMGDLADAAGVNRSTLYRRHTDRDQLLGEVIWSMAEPALDEAVRNARGSGGMRIADALGAFAAVATGEGPFNDFLRREPERALRVMTTRPGGVARRLIGKVEDLVEAEAAAGRLRLVLSPADTALLLVRITEAFVYTGAITGEEPDVSKVRLACAVLLGAIGAEGGE